MQERKTIGEQLNKGYSPAMKTEHLKGIVPLQNLIESLEGGESIEDFLDGFPSVKREQVLAVIEAGKVAILESGLPVFRVEPNATIIPSGRAKELLA